MEFITQIVGLLLELIIF